MVPAVPTRNLCHMLKARCKFCWVCGAEKGRVFDLRVCVVFLQTRVIWLGKSFSLQGFICSLSWLVDIRSVGIGRFRSVICEWFFFTHAFAMPPCP